MPESISTTKIFDLEKTLKALQLILVSGTLFSAISTPVVIYSYCQDKGITFLAPLVFSKISFNTFLFFLTLVLFILILPIYSGFMGGLLATEKENASKSIYQSCTGIGLTKSKKNNFLYLVLLNKGIIFTILIFTILILGVSIFLVSTYGTHTTAFSISLPVLIFLFYYFIGFLILKYMDRGKMHDLKLSSFFISPSIPALGGMLSSFVYLFLLESFFPDRIWLVLMMSVLIPPFLSIGSFSIILHKGDEKNFKEFFWFLVIVVFGFIVMRSLSTQFLSDNYFKWMRYGQVPVQIVQPLRPNEIGPVPYFTGMLLFNSGSELYVTDLTISKNFQKCTKKSLTESSTCITLNKKKIFSNNLSKESPIVRIAYKNLVDISSF